MSNDTDRKASRAALLAAAAGLYLTAFLLSPTTSFLFNSDEAAVSLSRVLSVTWHGERNTAPEISIRLARDQVALQVVAYGLVQKRRRGAARAVHGAAGGRRLRMGVGAGHELSQGPKGHGRS